jgi:hypothetical protein
MNEDIIEKMGDIEHSINSLSKTLQYAFSGTDHGMGVVEGGFARSHDCLYRIADALESIVVELSKLNNKE